jgi:two-component system phosphate regulon sensor histidine kinase PhoR
LRLRPKLLLILLAVTALSCVALGVAAGRLLTAAVRTETGARLHAEAALLAAQVARIEGASELQSFAEETCELLGVRVSIIDAAGRVQADSDVVRSRVPGMDDHSRRPEILAAREAGVGEARRESATTGVAYHYLARRIAADQGGFLRLALPVSRLERVETRYRNLLVGGVLAGLVLFGLLSYLIVAQVARPVERMTGVVSRIARGELDLEVPHSADGELGQLGLSVNRMKDSLVAEIRQRAEEGRLLQAMTGGLREGLLLLSPERRVLLSNQAFRRIFQIGFDPVDRLVGEIVRDPTVLELVRGCLDDGVDRRTTVLGTPGAGRSFELQVSAVEIPDHARRGVLVRFFDVTRLEALEQVRQRFIADVSHELRTPITAIKGAVESMMETALIEDPEAQPFLQMASRQAERMGELISDLTALSQIETGAVSLNLATVSLRPLVEEVVDAVMQRHGRDQVAVGLEIPEGFEVHADRRRLEQILINLVDNAVKFTPDGGRVTIAAASRPAVTEISVADTGPGIPPESQEKVFNRFFRVDPARSRAAGGTGLGLAIVKHLVRLHEGVVRLESKVGQGSRFIVEFPEPDTSG